MASMTRTAVGSLSPLLPSSPQHSNQMLHQGENRTVQEQQSTGSADKHITSSSSVPRPTLVSDVSSSDAGGSDNVDDRLVDVDQSAREEATKNRCLGTEGETEEVKLDCDEGGQEGADDGNEGNDEKYCVVIPGTGGEELKEEEGKGEKVEETKKKAKNWFICGIDGCTYGVKRMGNLRQHQMHIHGINIVWRYCPHCNYRSKNANNLKQHLSNIHNIGVVWCVCK